MAAQALLGHDSLSSTAYYLSANEPAEMRRISQRLRDWTPPTGEPKQ